MIMASAAPLNDSKAKKSSGCGGGGGTGASAGLRPPEQGLKCPRCDSPSTKFCYYNNYSLTQPRHFCKSCRRYWTKGGALRNVPVGGGCRKNKKSKSSSSSASCSNSPSTSSHLILDAIAAIPEPTDAAAGLKFLTQTAMDFHLGYLPFSSGNQLNSFGCFSSQAGATSTSMVGFSYNPIGAACSSNGSNSNYSSIASSIESLSSINQDLHWRLQQQRMAMLYGSEAHKESVLSVTDQSQVVEPMSAFGVAESNKCEIFGDSTAANGSCSSRKGSHDAAGTAWFLDGSFAMPASGSMNNTDANLNIGSNAASDWNGITAWGDVQQFTALP